MIFSIQLLLFVFFMIMKERRRNRRIRQSPLSILTLLFENPVVARDALFIAITNSGVSRKERLFARAMASGIIPQLITRLLFKTKEHVRAPLDIPRHASMIRSRISSGFFVMDDPFPRIRQMGFQTLLSDPRRRIVMKFMTNDISQQDMCLSPCHTFTCTESYESLNDLYYTIMRTAKISSDFHQVCSGEPDLKDKLVLNMLVGLVFEFDVEVLNGWLEKQQPMRWSRLLVSSGSSVIPSGSSDDNCYD